MHFVSLGDLRDGMVLGMPVYGAKLDVIAGEGTPLSLTHLERLETLGYTGAYIDAPESRAAVVEDVVPGELRIAAAKAARAFHEMAGYEGPSASGKTIRAKSAMPQRQIIASIVDHLIGDQNRVYDIVDMRATENYDACHAAGVAILSLLVGVRMGILGTSLSDLGIGALLHDVGAAFISKDILDKPGKLSAEEFAQVKGHTEMGFHFLREQFDLSIEACMGAMHHHENFDGSGYPAGLKADKISLFGRIISATAVFDALVARRPYRMPMPPIEAMEYMRIRAGTEFDPAVVRELEQVVAHYPAGSRVTLNTGVRCLVVQNVAGFPSRPRLHILNSLARSPMLVDLAHDEHFAGLHIMAR